MEGKNRSSILPRLTEVRHFYIENRVFKGLGNQKNCLIFDFHLDINVFWNVHSHYVMENFFVCGEVN